MNKKSGYEGNKNAAKPTNEKSTGHIHVRCRLQDKALWDKMAQSEGMKPAQWIIKTLNKAANQIE